MTPIFEWPPFDIITGFAVQSERDKSIRREYDHERYKKRTSYQRKWYEQNKEKKAQYYQQKKESTNAN